MNSGKGSPRAAAKLGLFLASVVLALSVPAAAFAVNTAVFSFLAPRPGAIITDSTPMLSVVVYDKYGVKGRPNPWSMTLDGVRVAVRINRYTGWGWKKFKLSYQVPSSLSLGSHMVVVRIRDLKARTSRKTWRFTVADGTAPVTTSDAALNYPAGSATIHLSATDNGVVANTYYRLDGGAQTAGTVITVPGSDTLPMHSLEFWSVDTAGNVEAHHMVSFFVPATVGPEQGFVHAVPNLSCNVTGCHDQKDVATIHLAVGCDMCHGTGITPKVTCNAADCHGNTPPHHGVADHPVVPSVPTTAGAPVCTQSGCHGALVVTIHGGNCALCHASARADVKAAIASGHATCETCHINAHTPDFTSIHVVPAGSHTVAGACFGALCHASTDVSVIHTRGDDPPGCAACHGAGITPSLVCDNCHHNIGTIHNFVHADAGGTKSTACIACHGSDLPVAHDGTFTEQANLGCFCHTGSIFDLSGEMGPLLAAGDAECYDCHQDPHAAHGFDMKASGHNTTTYGTVGAYTKWDGSEGVVVKDSESATITQDWPLPTSGVFWSQSVSLPDGLGGSLNPTDAPAIAMANKGGTDMASKINTTVGWGSVITCQDCHTGLNAVGPHGEAQNWGLDPNFPDDWTKAEITSFDPTGMRSIETTLGSPNPYYAKLGSKVWPPEGSTGTTDKPNVWKNGSNVGTATISEGGFYDTTSTPSTGYSAGVVTGRFICQKCHKLTNSYQGLGIEGNGRGFRSNNFNYMGFSNEAHMEHHADLVTGQANCVSCHIAVPHGWSRPRLLVYESDPAPYKVQWVFPGYQTSAAQALNADLSQGNWGFLGWNGLGSAPGNSSRYKLIGAAIPNGTTGAGVNEIDPVAGVTVDNTGKTYSTHLEKLAAGDTALKELAVGPGDNDNDGDDQDFANNDTFNGTSWGKWVQTAYGSEWLPDSSPNALYANEAIQNNCNACTSAGLTHSDTGGTGEGVAETAVPGRTPVGGVGTWSRIPFWK